MKGHEGNLHLTNAAESSSTERNAGAGAYYYQRGSPSLDHRMQSVNQQCIFSRAHESIQSRGEEITDTLPRRSSRMNIQGKLYLAPLSTLGNLPFRRLCVDFGADVTCSEMVMATELLKGSPSEWALVRRHSSEKFFGVQLCGSSADVMAKAAQLLLDEAKVDFLDINAACPRNAICNMGAGCSLMNDTNRLGEIVDGMRSVMRNVPLTVKFRTGMEMGKRTAHEVLKVLENFDVDLVTLHGRSKEQPDSEPSDWAYVEECAKLIYPLPMVGVGDVLGYIDYYHNLDAHTVAGVMIGRGALIKPWIFREIQERRHWDISASERLEILKRFVVYGLDHWGADQEGTNRTRYFLLEWLSFLYRYVPVGLLEYLPQRMVDRFPRYFGRNDLETLMASDHSADWIKISEMLLGPAPDGFRFIPKHKAKFYLLSQFRSAVPETALPQQC
uniref:tRNA-dihydrouridine(47) synthase [NAD(P)(+)] n=1 Tax=Trichuris muris TaxID=70415 RepID=A0A5S6QY33_TRIMR